MLIGTGVFLPIPCDKRNEANWLDRLSSSEYVNLLLSNSKAIASGFVYTCVSNISRIVLSADLIGTEVLNVPKICDSSDLVSICKPPIL